MKRMLMAIVASTVVVVGMSSTVIAQSPRETLIDSIGKMRLENSPVTDHESDPAVEERNLKNEFRGTKLTAQQFAQIRKARRQLRTELKQVMSKDLGQILQLVFLPKAEADQQSVKLLGNPLKNYAQSLSSILTPEQLKIWQRNAEQGARDATSI